MTNPEKKLGYWDGAALIFSNVVGVGIFTTPGIVAKSIQDESTFILAWIFGGLFAFVEALAYSELSSSYPKAGGEYIYLKNAFGPLVGFLSGWTSFVAGFSGAIAASAIGFGIYLNRLTPVHINEVGVSIGLIVIISIIHILSVKAGSRFHYWLGGLALIAIVFLIVMGLYHDPVPGSTQSISNSVDTDFSSFLLALIPILFTYSGWNAAVYIAEEIRQPERNMFKSLLLGTLMVIIIYVLLNILFLNTIGIYQISKSVEVGYEMGIRLLGNWGYGLITVIILLALLSSISAMIMAGPRIYFAMSRDGLFPKSIRSLHSKYKTPYLSIIAQSIWSILLVLSGTFEEILIYTGFSLILFTGLSVLSVNTNGHLKISLFKRIVFLIFIIICLAIVLNGIYSAPKPTLLGCVIIALGIPFYFWFRTSSVNKR